jgi:hypothetical protein
MEEIVEDSGLLKDDVSATAVEEEGDETSEKRQVNHKPSHLRYYRMSRTFLRKQVFQALYHLSYKPVAIKIEHFQVCLYGSVGILVEMREILFHINKAYIE